jgi:Xaa-Pro aminopeptidase
MNAIFEKRIQKMLKLAGRGLQGVLITNPENIRYLCGFTGTEGTLLLAGGSSFFLTDGRYTTQAGQQVHAGRIITFKDKAKELARLVKKCGLETLGYESRHMTVAQLRDLERELAGVRLIEQPDAFDALRMVKDAAEIKLLARAAEIAAASLADTCACIRIGMSEREVAAELEYRMRKNGGTGAAFPTIVASGARSALPHGTASAKRLARGELLLIDYGVVYEGYCSDETCTFVLGEPSAKQRRIYATVKKAHDRALAALRPGKTLREVDAAARGYIVACGLGRCFSHGTGHGLGLCVHEQPVVSPRSKSVAQKGMVITIEPGVYLPGWGGVRIEDTVVVTAGGCTLLTRTDKSLQIIGS